jgi:hypothetical protein
MSYELVNNGSIVHTSDTTMIELGRAHEGELRGLTDHASVRVENDGWARFFQLGVFDDSATLTAPPR